ncbi:MAG: hypothetical protein ABMB14_34960 [Myxococcota bacterium]
MLGQAHGFVWGGGALIVRAPTAPAPALAVWPHGPDAGAARVGPIGPTDRPSGGTTDQARAVDALVEA